MIRILSALIALLFLTIPASSAISIVQNSGQQTASNITVATYSFPVQPTVGNHIIIVLTGWRGPGGVSGVSDNQSGNSYNIDKQQIGGNSGTRVTAVVSSGKITASSGTFTVSVTFVATNTYAQWAVLEVSGLNTTTWLDQTGANTSAATSTSLTVTASGANTQANDLVVAAFAGDSTNGISNPPSGYTSLYVDQDAVVTGAEGAYKIVSGVETSASTWTFNASGFGTAGVLATYKAAAGGGGAAPTRSLLGVGK